MLDVNSKITQIDSLLGTATPADKLTGQKLRDDLTTQAAAYKRVASGAVDGKPVVAIESDAHAQWASLRATATSLSDLNQLITMAGGSAVVAIGGDIAGAITTALSRLSSLPSSSASFALLASRMIANFSEPQKYQASFYLPANQRLAQIEDQLLTLFAAVDLWITTLTPATAPDVTRDLITAAIGSTWTATTLDSGLSAMLQSSTTAPKLIASLGPFNIAAGSVIKSVVAKFAASQLSHGALPATKPSVTLQEIDPDSGTVLSSIAITDPSATLGAYEAAHSIELQPLVTTVAGHLYTVKISGESGANSLANSLALLKLSATWTPPA